MWPRHATTLLRSYEAQVGPVLRSFNEVESLGEGWPAIRSLPSRKARISEVWCARPESNRWPTD